MQSDEKKCIFCEGSREDVPLLTFQFKTSEYQICPQHLPLLIHNPAALSGRLPGAEHLRPADHHD